MEEVDAIVDAEILREPPLEVVVTAEEELLSLLETLCRKGRVTILSTSNLTAGANLARSGPHLS